MAILIAIYGAQQAGKTTAATALTRTREFTRVAFADPLYRMVGALLNINAEQVRKLPKNEPLEGLGNQTLRHTLQTLGTEWGRNYLSADIWPDIAVRKIQEHLAAGQSVVVDDMRFHNEYAALAKLGCRFVRIERSDLPQQTNVTHESESAWQSFHSDSVVTNPLSDAIPRSLWDATISAAVIDSLAAA